MPLILLDGFEDDTAFPGGGGVSPTYGRNGNGAQSGTFRIPVAQQSNEFTVGVALRTGYSIGGNLIWAYAPSGNASIALVMSTSGALSIVRSATTILGPTANGVMPLNTWTYVEMQGKIHDTTGYVTTRINGVVNATLSGTGLDTQAGGASGAVPIELLALLVMSPAPFGIDDLYLMTGAGDSFLGDITVETLYPSGNGNASAWVGSDGDSVNNFALVSETGTPVTTTYTGSPTTGAQDLYTLTDLTHTNGTIVGVCHQAYAAASNVGDKRITIVNRRAADTKALAFDLASTYGPFHYCLATDPELPAAGGNLLFTEPFDNISAWTLDGSSLNWTFPAGRTGNCARNLSSGDHLIRAFGTDSATATLGFAFNFSMLWDNRPIASFWGDGYPVSQHVTLASSADGSLRVLRGNEFGTLLGGSPAGLITANTWNYIEFQATLSDTVGKIEVRLNGTTVIGPTTGLDTKNAGTKTVFDTVLLHCYVGGTVSQFDDLYLRNDAGFGTPWTIANVNSLQSGVEVFDLPVTSGLQLWLDAADATTFAFSSGTVVSQWNDRSGNGRNASQATVADQPTRNGTQNGRPAVAFGAGDVLATAAPVSTATSDLTMIVACHRTSLPNAFISIPFMNDSTGGAGYAVAIRANDANMGTLLGGVAWVASTTLDTGQPGVYALTRQAGGSGAWSLHYNGNATSLSVTTSPTTPAGSTHVGDGNFAGLIYEVLFYNRALTTTERQQVEAYLRLKWGTP